VRTGRGAAAERPAQSREENLPPAAICRSPGDVCARIEHCAQAAYDISASSDRNEQRREQLDQVKPVAAGADFMLTVSAAAPQTRCEVRKRARFSGPP